MKKTIINLIIIFAVVFLWLCPPVFCADFYIAQSAAGSADGSSCANAHALSGLTWGAGTDVEAGDTLHLCGTITSTLDIGASGSVGNPITILFETGSKLSKAYWGVNGTAAISIYGRDYITVNGGSNGIIENTDNGTGSAYGGSFTNQQDSYGIYIDSGSDHITIENLTIQNLYVRLRDTNDSNGGSCRGISAETISNLTISGITITNSKYGIIALANNGDTDALTIHDSSISLCSTAIAVAAQNTGGSYTNVNIYDNSLFDGYPWDAPTDIFHNDGIHIWQDNVAKVISPINIYRNKIYGDWGARITGWIFTEGKVSELYIHDNELSALNHAPAEAFMDLGSSATSATVYVYGNTVYGTSSSTGGTGLRFLGSGFATIVFKNNIFNNLRTCIDYLQTLDPTGDNNLYYGFTNLATLNDGSNQTGYLSDLADWRTQLGGCPGTGNDCSSLDTDPLFVSSSNFNLQSGSPAIDSGSTLGSPYNVDVLGISRPQGALYDMGAYEYQVPYAYGSGKRVGWSGSGGSFR